MNSEITVKMSLCVLYNSRNTAKEAIRYSIHNVVSI